MKTKELRLRLLILEMWILIGIVVILFYNIDSIWQQFFHIIFIFGGIAYNTYLVYKIGKLTK